MAETAGQVVFDAIQSTHDLDADLDGAALVGFVVVAEWSGQDGQRWLSRIARDINGEGPPVWTTKGWLFDALHGTWDEESTDG